MKKFLFLAFAISLMLFCSVSHEVFSGVSPPVLFNYNDKTKINDFTIYTYTNKQMEQIIKGMQYRSSLWV